MNPFAPHGYLEPFNSLNRVMMTGEYEGVQAVQLISADALIVMIEEAGLAERLSENYPKREWPRGLTEIAFGECPSAERQRAARRIIDEYAERVRRFVLVLLDGPAEARQARTDWDESHWDWWAGVDKIVFSGGLSLGYFGYAIKAALRRDHAGGRREFLFPRRRAILPMAGAALMASSGRDASADGGIVALDFGHSSVKSGLFTRSANHLVDYIPLGQIPTPRDFSMLEGTWHAENEPLRAFFFGRIHSAIEEAEHKDGPLVGLGISIANYVQDGRVVPRGLYGLLRRDDTDEGRDSNDIGIEIVELCRKAGLGSDDYSFMHDGTAAAVPYADLPGRTAVIVLGSAIGGGFPTAAPKAGLALDGFM